MLCMQWIYGGSVLSGHVHVAKQGGFTEHPEDMPLAYMLVVRRGAGHLEFPVVIDGLF